MIRFASGFVVVMLAADVPVPPESVDTLAARLLDTHSHYVSRADALLMDDRPDVRAALKRLVVKRDLMMAYQATMFDDGFGHAVVALMHARDAVEESRLRQLPDIPIRFGDGQ